MGMKKIHTLLLVGILPHLGWLLIKYIQMQTMKNRHGVWNGLLHAWLSFCWFLVSGGMKMNEEGSDENHTMV